MFLVIEGMVDKFEQLFGSVPILSTTYRKACSLNALEIPTRIEGNHRVIVVMRCRLWVEEESEREIG